jgi:hypothetical protein
VELPTYTNIWKIEKRLYKLYDFRLPMPLPVGQIAAFLAIAVPYMFILTMVGMPFSHTWLWLYVLPPGVLAWLVTRPVLEGKRLPELAASQLRYLGEPRTWCRMAPLAEQDEVFVVARSWRSADYVRPAQVSPSGAAAALPMAVRAAPSQVGPAQSGRAQAVLAARGRAEAVPAHPASDVPAPAAPVPAQSASQRLAPPRQVRERGRARLEPAAPGLGQPGSAGLSQPGSANLGQPGSAGLGQPDAPASSPGRPVWPIRQPAPAAPTGPVPRPRSDAPSSAAPPPAAPPSAARPPAARPIVQVAQDGSEPRPLNVVERALRSSPGGRAGGRREPVVIVPGGHRPGKPDQVQRDQARARLPLEAPARVVVLGCTAGAGQTITTLLTGQLLASLRGEAVAVLDLGHGQGSLTEQARTIPMLLPSQRAGAGVQPATASAERGLQVVTTGGSEQDAAEIINSVVARYRLTLADPDATCVPKTMSVADQLILVAPASEEAAGSLAMTLEWLEAHGHGRLAKAAITVLNGVSGLTAQHAGKAATVASGRCRAIVQVPWDEQLRGRFAAADRLPGNGPAAPAAVAAAGSGSPSASRALALTTVQAYTALAGVLVASLVDAQARSAVR